MTTTPAVGDIAPDFTLPGTAPGSEDRPYTLSAERGHPVVLAFYPGDETPVCTKQLCSYQHDLAVLTDLQATLWGISSQGIGSHKTFQSHRGLTFPLLADTDNEVFAAYGLGLGLARRRALFVVDAEGRIAYAHVHRLGLTYQKVDQIAEVLRTLPALTAYPDESGTPETGRRARNAKG
jgi:thioredoxin-dependent peroxiredoxin